MTVEGSTCPDAAKCPSSATSSHTRRLAGPASPRGEPDALDDIEVFGGDTAAAHALLQATDAAAEAAFFDLWPENWDAAQISIRLQTQWICDAMTGDPLRLHHQATRVVLELARVGDIAEVFGHLQVMERAATN